MSAHIQQPVFVLGPTGSGKSAVAVALAELLGDAEIVSADAYQVYREMPVLTAAPTAGEQARVPHHLVGFMGAGENNDAALHARRAQEAIQGIHARGRRAIVTGGSGLYVKFISHGISPAPPGDPALRAELAALPAEEAVRRLQQADPEGAAATNLQNPRYVVRNLEIVLLGGKPLSYWQQNWQHGPAGPGFCIVRDTAELDSRILRRTGSMLAQGAIGEVRALDPLSLSTTAAKTLGLSHIQQYLQETGGESADFIKTRTRQLRDDIALLTRQYAKRQRTWLRREQWLTPLPATAGSKAPQLAAQIAAMLGR